MADLNSAFNEMDNLLKDFIDVASDVQSGGEVDSSCLSSSGIEKLNGDALKASKANKQIVSNIILEVLAEDDYGKMASGLGKLIAVGQSLTDKQCSPEAPWYVAPIRELVQCIVSGQSSISDVSAKLSMAIHVEENFAYSIKEGGAFKDYWGLEWNQYYLLNSLINEQFISKFDRDFIECAKKFTVG